MAAPLIAFSAEDSKGSPKPDSNRTNGAPAAASTPMTAVKESLLKGLRPENLKPGEYESLQREIRTLFGPAKQLKDLSTLEILRLLDRVMSEGTREAKGGRSPGDERRQAGRPELERRPRGGGGPPPGGRRGGFRGGMGRAAQPFLPEPYPDSGQFVSPFAQGAFDEESLQDPEIILRSYETMISRFARQRRNMAITHFRLGQLYEKLEQREKAVQAYRTVLKHYSDIDDVRGDSEKALKKLEGGD